MPTFRTLSERRATDPSLQTLRFPRTQREAGLIGDMTDDSPSPGGWVAMLVCAVVGALLLWGLLVLVLSPEPDQRVAEMVRAHQEISR